MPLLPFGEYKPDVSDYEGQATLFTQNAVPRGDGYGPFPSLSLYSKALPGPCRGAFYALKSDGSVAVFAGTATGLYLLNSINYTWTNVSQSGSYSTLLPSAQWRFAQFNNFVVAVQAATAPQVFNIASDTKFSDLGGSPPQAAYVDVVGRFLVLSGLVSNPFRIQWSGLDDPGNWTSGVNSSDYQDFPDGGVVRGVAGGEAGIIFQDQAIRRMSYIPGSPLVFQIERISQDKGLFAPYSIARAGERIFFYSSQGFQRIDPGGIPEQIGRERVDRTFLNNLDRGNLQLFQAAADPRSSKVYWAYKSSSGVVNGFDQVLGYDFALDRFFPLQISGQYLLGISQTGMTLEGLDAISSSIDAMTLPLDAYATAVQPEIGMFDGTNSLGFFRGASLETILQTGEQGTDGRRIYVNGFRPITDAPVVYGAMTYRDTVQETPATLSEVPLNARTGRCDLRRSTRYTRYQVRVPAGTAWNFVAGVEPDVRQEGLQ